MGICTMLVTIVLETGDERTVLSHGRETRARCACPACGDPLVIETPRDDTDAWCTVCGCVVGRAYPRSVVSTRGVSTRRRGA